MQNAAKRGKRRHPGGTKPDASEQIGMLRIRVPNGAPPGYVTASAVNMTRPFAMRGLPPDAALPVTGGDEVWVKVAYYYARVDRTRR